MRDSADDVRTGSQHVTTFYLNPKSDSAFRFRATHLDGARAPKVVLTNDPAVRVGQALRVRVVRVTRPGADGRGHIEVEVVGPEDFSLGEAIYVDPILERKLQALLECGMNILLDGPQGSGKTVTSRAIADALSMEYVFFNCAAVYEATDFLASLQVRAGEGGVAETVWIPTDIRRALEAAQAEPGRRWLIFLDEFNRCREMARNGIMPALDATRKLFDPLTGSMLDIPDNVQWIAAINTGAEFTGTTSVDPAQLDRFAPLKMHYPPVAEEVRLLAKRHPSVPLGVLKKAVHAADAVRQDDTLRVDLSMRATDEVATLLAHPNFADDAAGCLAELMKTSYCGRYQGRWDDPATDAGMVWGVIVRALEL